MKLLVLLGSPAFVVHVTVLLIDACTIRRLFRNRKLNKYGGFYAFNNSGAGLLSRSYSFALRRFALAR